MSAERNFTFDTMLNDAAGQSSGDAYIRSWIDYIFYRSELYLCL